MVDADLERRLELRRALVTVLFILGQERLSIGEKILEWGRFDTLPRVIPFAYLQTRYSQLLSLEANI